jgi:hypothetical protein
MISYNEFQNKLTIEDNISLAEEVLGEENMKEYREFLESNPILIGRPEYSMDLYLEFLKTLGRGWGHIKGIGKSFASGADDVKREKEEQQREEELRRYGIRGIKGGDPRAQALLDKERFKRMTPEEQIAYKHNKKQQGIDRKIELHKKQSKLDALTGKSPNEIVSSLEAALAAKGLPQNRIDVAVNWIGKLLGI